MQINIFINIINYEMKRIKITEEQFNQLKTYLMEAPFSYLGNETSDTNHNSEVMVNTPYDSPDCNPINITGDDVAHELSNTSWWNRRR